MNEYDPALDIFLNELADMLDSGLVTPRDVYETMMEANDNNHQLAMSIKERAMVIAGTYHSRRPAIAS